MATESRRARTPLIERLLQEPYAFEFFQAVRILEEGARRAAVDAAAPAPARIGEDGDPLQESARFRATVGLSFPAAAVNEVQRASGDEGDGMWPRRPSMAVSFLGLTGQSGVLPQRYTELMIRSVRAKDNALRDFFDLFNHRAISFFYRAWQKYRLPPAYERAGPGGNDPISLSLFAIIGFATGHLRGRLKVEDETLLYYCGHLAHWPRSAMALEAMLSDYAGRPVRVEQFRGRWLALALDQRSALPSPAAPQGQFMGLGVDAVVGERVWDVQGNFRLRIGPLSYEQFARLMPGSEELARLAQLTQLYAGPELEFDVQLTLAKEEVPRLRVGAEGIYQPRLGWNSWLKHVPFREDSSDAVFAV